MSQLTLRAGDCVIRLVRGDITEQQTVAIVNAANSTLLGGGGVDGAIHRKGGPSILEECKQIRASRYPAGLPTGTAVITTGGALKARFVIHTVGPVWRGGGSGEPADLANCYTSVLALAKERRISSVAFPSISTGAYGYPVGEASGVAVSSVKRFLVEEGFPKEVVFVLFSQSDFDVYARTAKSILGRPIPGEQ